MYHSSLLSRLRCFYLHSSVDNFLVLVFDLRTFIQTEVELAKEFLTECQQNISSEQK